MLCAGDAEEHYLHLTPLQRLDVDHMVPSAGWLLVGRWNLGCDFRMVSLEICQARKTVNEPWAASWSTTLPLPSELGEEGRAFVSAERDIVGVE